MRKYLPLIVVELYLLVTLLLFFVGPIKYHVHNLLLFVVLMILCHSYFMVGYILGIKMTYNSTCLKANNDKLSGMFWVLFCVGLISIWGSYRNIMLSRINYLQYPKDRAETLETPYNKHETFKACCSKV